MNDSNQTLFCRLEPLIYLPLSTINVLHSSFSVILFLLKGKEIHRLLKKLLIVLGLFETFFHLSVILKYMFTDSSRGLEHSQSHVMLISVTMRTALTLRNWCIVLVSWCRVEAVVRPFSARHGVFLTDQRLFIILGILISLTTSLSIFMELSQHADYFPTFFTNSYVIYLSETLFYTFQGLLPVMLVIIATGIITCSLKNNNIRPFNNCYCIKRSENHSHYQHQQQRLVHNLPTISNRKEKQAIQIIIALSITFAILELPTDLFGYFQMKYCAIELFVNTLVEIDSLANFIIYTSTTRIFRRICQKNLLNNDSQATNTVNNSIQYLLLNFSLQQL